MKKSQFLTLALTLALTGLSLPAGAAMCTLDDVPAATLLLPYFEVDLEDPQGTNTVFSINNFSADASLAHVTLWTDWSQPTFNFDVFLTGYDVVTVDLREIFDGIFPITADAQNDPDDTISPHGINPIWDGSFPGCLGVFPFGEPGMPVVSGANLTRLRNGHTGQDVLGLGCMGEDHGDGVARGYITVDAVNHCSTVFPHEIGYFQDGGLGIAINENVLWGRYAILEADGRAFGDSLVAIEAEDGFNGSAEVPGYTFYGRYDPGLTGADNREPLATVWAADYLNPGGAEQDTEILVWRDSTTADTQEFYPCGVGPSWNPKNEAEVVLFDQEENAVETCFSDAFKPLVDEIPCFPLETQRLRIGAGDLVSPYANGWFFLNLNHNDVGVDFDVDFGQTGDITQSHVTVIHSLGGQLQTGYSALVWSHACEDASPFITETGLIPVL